MIFGLRASVSIKITYFLFYRKIMLASVIVWLMPRHEGTQSFGARYPYNTLNVPS